MLAHVSFGDKSKQLVETTVSLGIQGNRGDHCTSAIFFIHLELKFEQKPPEENHMLLKISPEDLIYRTYVDTDVLLHNEALMCAEVITFMKEFLRKRRTVSVGCS
jgi:hypothetical protein